MRSAIRKSHITANCLILVLALLVALPTLAGDIFRGEQLYQTHCISCHGAGGRPVMPGAADFSRGQGLMQPDTSIMQVILSGKNAMPGFRGILRDTEILDVISYIRTL